MTFLLISIPLMVVAVTIAVMPILVLSVHEHRAARLAASPGLRRAPGAVAATAEALPALGPDRPDRMPLAA